MCTDKPNEKRKCQQKHFLKRMNQRYGLKLNRVSYLKIVEAIQFDDPEEGGKKLSEFMRQQANEVKHQITTDLRRQEIGREMDETIRAFSEQNRDISANDGATRLMRDYAAEETILRLRNAGVVDENQAASLRTNPALAGAIYLGARAEG